MNSKTIYHVCFGEDEHYYFGSAAAIFERFSPEQIGLSYSRVRALGIKPGKPYKGKKCTIYRGELTRKEKKKT